MEELYTYVPFSRIPRLHHQGLIDFLHSLNDTKYESFTGTDLIPCEENSHCISRGEIHSGDMTVKLELCHIPLPAEVMQHSVEIADLSPAEIATLNAHTCFIKCTTPASPQISPVEALIFHLKIGMGLCAQEGLAFINEINSVCIPERILRAYARHARSGPQPIGFADLDLPQDEPEQNLWDSLREEGIPGDLLVGFLPVDIKGKLCFITAGHSFFGFPELAFTNADPEDYDRIEEHFRNIFSHMISSASPVTVDSSLESDLTAYHFKPLPPTAKELEGPTTTLLVEINEFSTE